MFAGTHYTDAPLLGAAGALRLPCLQSADEHMRQQLNFLPSANLKRMLHKNAGGSEQILMMMTYRVETSPRAICNNRTRQVRTAEEFI